MGQAAILEFSGELLVLDDVWRTSQLTPAVLDMVTLRNEQSAVGIVLVPS